MVGPETYMPNHPTHVDKGIKIGNSQREVFKKTSVQPAPNTYKIEGDFEKSKANPKFHMGIKYN